MRLFIAVWPPPSVLEVLRSLERPPVPGVRWTTEDQWHVTLRFLGEVGDPSSVPPLDGLPAATAVLGPATERLGRTLLVVPVAGLDELAAAVPVPSARSFAGHLTLARARRGSTIPRSLVGAPVAASWPVGDVALVRSTTLPSGAVYDDVATFPAEGA